MTEPTPRPWRSHKMSDGKYSGIYEPLPDSDFGSKSLVMCANFKGQGPDDLWLQCKDVDMALIVRAVNCHEALAHELACQVNVLNNIVARIEMIGTSAQVGEFEAAIDSIKGAAEAQMKRARAALDKVEGES